MLSQTELQSWNISHPFHSKVPATTVLCSLYKHSNVIDETEFMGDGKTLSGRTFSSHDFASSLDMKPIGLAWCQVHWDESVTSTCSLLEDLNGEPMFELEEYIDPKQEFRNTISENKELNYRNM